MVGLLDLEDELIMLKARRVVGVDLFGAIRREANAGTLRTLKLAIREVGY